MRDVRAGLVALILLLACVAGPAAAERIEIPSNPIPTMPMARSAPGPLSGQLTRPPGPGPAPAIILLHGCGGLGRSMNPWVTRVTGWGYAALVLRSFPARHVRTVCAPENQPEVTPADRAGDAMNAAIALQTVLGIDGARIGVIGFSHGGNTAATLTRIEFEQFRPGLIKAAVDYYGPCRNARRHGTVPLLALNGDDDDWGHPPVTCRKFGESLRVDQPFELHTYPSTPTPARTRASGSRVCRSPCSPTSCASTASPRSTPSSGCACRWMAKPARRWRPDLRQAASASAGRPASSHSRSLVQRRPPRLPRTACARARRWPTSTTTRRPRVTPV